LKYILTEFCEKNPNNNNTNKTNKVNENIITKEDLYEYTLKKIKNVILENINNKFTFENTNNSINALYYHVFIDLGILLKPESLDCVDDRLFNKSLSTSIMINENNENENIELENNVNEKIKEELNELKWEELYLYQITNADKFFKQKLLQSTNTNNLWGFDDEPPFTPIDKEKENKNSNHISVSVQVSQKELDDDNDVFNENEEKEEKDENEEENQNVNTKEVIDDVHDEFQQPFSSEVKFDKIKKAVNTLNEKNTENNTEKTTDENEFDFQPSKDKNQKGANEITNNIDNDFKNFEKLYGVEKSTHNMKSENKNDLQNVIFYLIFFLMYLYFILLP